MFPNIVRILSIILTTPATSASVEKPNSVVYYVKTDFRGAMSGDRFNALLLLSVHRDIKLDCKKLIIMYAMRYPGRMVLKNLINSTVADEKSVTSFSGSLKFFKF